jgi:hypothetical protein
MQTSTQKWEKKRRKENLGIKLLHIRSPINMCFLTFVVGTSVWKWALCNFPIVFSREVRVKDIYDKGHANFWER